MKFTVTSNDLLLQLQAVAKVINQKSVAAVPVLENILFELQGNILTLTAADQPPDLRSRSQQPRGRWLLRRTKQHHPRRYQGALRPAYRDRRR